MVLAACYGGPQAGIFPACLALAGRLTITGFPEMLDGLS